MFFLAAQPQLQVPRGWHIFRIFVSKVLVATHFEAECHIENSTVRVFDNNHFHSRRTYLLPENPSFSLLCLAFDPTVPLLAPIQVPQLRVWPKSRIASRNGEHRNSTEPCCRARARY